MGTSSDSYFLQSAPFLFVGQERYSAGYAKSKTAISNSFGKTDQEAVVVPRKNIPARRFGIVFDKNGGFPLSRNKPQCHRVLMAKTKGP